MTPKMGQLPRVEDDNLSDSSSENFGHKSHLDEIYQMAVQHNQFSISINYNKGESLPIQ